MMYFGRIAVPQRVPLQSQLQTESHVRIPRMPIGGQIYRSRRRFPAEPTKGDQEEGVQGVDVQLRFRHVVELRYFVFDDSATSRILGRPLLFPLSMRIVPSQADRYRESGFVDARMLDVPSTVRVASAGSASGQADQDMSMPVGSRDRFEEPLV